MNEIFVVTLDDHPLVAANLAGAARVLAPDLFWAPSISSLKHLAAYIRGGGLQRAAAGREIVVLYDLNLGDDTDPTFGISKLTAMGLNVAVLTSEGRPVQLRRAFHAGAKGMALKGDQVEAIFEMIRVVAHGERALSSDVALRLVTNKDLTPLLSEREFHVLRLLAAGVPRKAVGKNLDPQVELATVATYLNRIFSKYQALDRDVTTSPVAVREATRDGYLSAAGSGLGDEMATAAGAVPVAGLTHKHVVAKR